MLLQTHPLDPELVCNDVYLPPSLEDEIKDGFYELKQKFNRSANPNIYISHAVLHEKHPLLKKIDISTLKMLIQDSQVVYLGEGQSLYRVGS